MIHNDHSRGSVNLFTDDQISLLEGIAKRADASFAETPLSTDLLNIADALAYTDVYLIPYTRFSQHMRDWCESEFAVRMRREYDEAIENLDRRRETIDRMYGMIRESDQRIEEEEINRIKGRIEEEKQVLEEIYEPWTSCPHISRGAVTYETPLGYFNPITGEVFICLDGIIANYPSKVESIAALTLFHELAHAIMHNSTHLHYDSAFEYWAEEALANKIALQTISVTKSYLPSLFSNAAYFVQHQRSAYKLGYDLYMHNLLDWKLLKNNKGTVNMINAEKWLRMVVSAGITSTNIDDVQKAYYMALTAKDAIYLEGYVDPMRNLTCKAFYAWLSLSGVGATAKSKTNTKENYRDAISSLHMGLVYRAMMWWKYDTLADCCSSAEVDALLKTLGKTGLYRDFNSATRGNSLSAAGKYKEFLEDLGL